MTTYDLHYHPNIHGLGKGARDARLARHRQWLKRAEVDVLACTEHSYKRPRESFLRLREACEGLHTVIIPGMECISREGVDLIYLYEDEHLLERARRTFTAYSWKVEDAGLLAGDTNGILMVPHPFGLGSACAGNILSPQRYAALLSVADYVEVHNGASLAGALLLKKAPRKMLPRVSGRCSQNTVLPGHLRGKGLGWSIGSDAHFPGEQYVVGGVRPGYRDESHFQALRRRLRFEPVWVRTPADRTSVHLLSVVMSGQCAAREGVAKRLGVKRRQAGNGAGGPGRFARWAIASLPG
ncbi:MAG: hypothetical protein ACLFOY_01450 [Desulfatibacillaceae bacterium]